MTGETGSSNMSKILGGGERDTETKPDEEDETGVKAKVRDVKRHSQMQTERCSRLLQRLKTHQMRVITDFGETQLESALNMLTYLENNQMLGGVANESNSNLNDNSTESSSGGGRQVGGNNNNVNVPGGSNNKGNNMVVEEAPEFLDRGMYSFATKNGIDDTTDVTDMIHQTLRELRMSSMMLGKDIYDTESDSDMEDEVEMLASKRSYNQEFHGYLNVDDNPATKWARKRHDIVIRWYWLKEAYRSVQERALQCDYLLQHLEACKPQFKFDPNPIYVGVPKKKAPSYRIPVEQCQVRTYNDTNQHVLSRASECLQKGKESYDIVGGGLENLKIKILDTSSDVTCQARRCMPLMKPYKPRKMYQIGGIHNIIDKRNKIRASTLCNCFGQSELCTVCTGRNDKVQPLVTGTTSRPELSALMDHTYHKTLSASAQKPLPRLIESCLKTEAWKKRKHLTADSEQNDSDSDTELGFTEGELRESNDQNMKKRTYSPTLLETVEPRRGGLRSRVKSSRGIKKVVTKKKDSKPKLADSKKSRKRASSRKIMNDDDDDEMEEVVIGKSVRTPSSTSAKGRHSRRINEKYDIDHVVIPYSIASTTRLEKIEYKEILIPSWREIAVSPKTKVNAEQTPSKSKRARLSASIGHSSSVSQEDDQFEDISLEAITARHMRSEIEEKQRFLKAMNKTSNRRPRRSESKADNMDSFSSNPGHDTEEFSPVKIKSEPVEYPPTNRNQISAAEASLAVTALKLLDSTGSRRRTTSSRAEDDETEILGGVPPFEPRRFPLGNEEYQKMCAETAEEYRLSQLPRSSYEDGFLKPKEEPADEDSDADTEEDDPDWRDCERLDTVTSHGEMSSRVTKRVSRGSIS